MQFIIDTYYYGLKKNRKIHILIVSSERLTWSETNSRRMFSTTACSMAHIACSTTA